MGMTYEKCSLCLGTLTVVIGAGGSCDCLCTTTATPGYAATGLTMQQIEKLHEKASEAMGQHTLDGACNVIAAALQTDVEREAWAVIVEKLGDSLVSADAMTNEELTAAMRESVASSLASVRADEDLLEVGWRSVAKAAFDRRDGRTSEVGVACGVVHNERDGRASETIRLTCRDAIRVALRAMAKHLDRESVA